MLRLNTNGEYKYYETINGEVVELEFEIDRVYSDDGLTFFIYDGNIVYRTPNPISCFTHYK